MLTIQRTKSASISGQQSDIASTTTAIARITIVRGRELFPPKDTLLLFPVMKTTGLSAFFMFSPPCYFWLPSAAGRTSPSANNKEICSLTSHVSHQHKSDFPIKGVFASQRLFDIYYYTQHI